MMGVNLVDDNFSSVGILGELEISRNWLHDKFSNPPTPHITIHDNLGNSTPLYLTQVKFDYDMDGY